MKAVIKLFVSVIIIVLFIVILTLSFNHEREISKNYISSKNTVVIDAGHGGKDVGAIGVDGSKEKDINLNISLDLYDYFMVCGIDSVLTRDSDFQTYFVEEERTKQDIYNRMDIVNSTPNSVLISIHQNHFSDEREHGTQIWYSTNNDNSKVLADGILASVKLFLQPNNKRENKPSDDSYYLLYKAKSPSIMVECGFISNNEENKLLQDTEYQKDIAYSIFIGACDKV